MKKIPRILSAAFAALVLTLTTTASAQYSYTILYDLGTTSNDGISIESGLVFDSHGNLYGSANHGGANGFGNVFQLSPSSGGGWTETVLYQFTGGSDGAYPSALAVDAHGNLFGTAAAGGSTTCNGGCGTVFELSPSAGGGWTESLIHTFIGTTDGDAPFSNIAFDSAGNLFGLTSGDGPKNWGTAYELSPVSGGGWTFSVVYPFDLFNTGGQPEGMALDSTGNLFGTTKVGGTEGAASGGVFRLSPASGTWAFTKIFEFYGPGGATPQGNLAFDSAGNLYGSTGQGGKKTSVCASAGGCGLIYKLTPTSSGPWKESFVHQFTGGDDGWYPTAGVALDSAGNIYGTAAYGGNGPCSPDSCGTAFKLTAVSGGWKFARLVSFSPTLGITPYGNVIVDSAGNVYGGTYEGGPTQPHCISGGGCGVVFELSPPADHE